MKSLRNILIALAFVALSASAVNAQTSGSCGANGNNLTWQLTGTGSNLTLTISGTGAMADYDYNSPYGSNAPWASQKDNIKILVLTSGMTTIGSYAFNVFSGLTSVTIPNSVTSIGGSAFCYCSGLTSITIPNNVTTIGDLAFYGCSGLTAINVETNNQNYSSNNGVLFNKNKTVLIQYPCGKTGTYTIPNSVTTIGNAAFCYCSGLTGALTIPNSVTSIEGMAFYDCSGLTSVTIPNSVTFIGGGAFSGCSGLTSVTVNWNTPLAIYSNTFSGTLSNIELYVPSGTKCLYGNASVWGNFNIIGTLPTITASAGSNGSISPSGTTEPITCGNNKTYTFTPNTDYEIDVVLVDNVPNATAKINGYHTFENVTANHTISVTFKPVENGILDTIRMVWQGSVEIIAVAATQGKTFRIDWGDGTIEVKTGNGTYSSVQLEHTYSNDNIYTVTISAASSDCFFTGFWCNYCRAISLNVKSAQLMYLVCNNNQLNSLNVSNCPQLIHLTCSNNQLSSLDVSNNTQLINLECSNNHLPLSELFIVSEALSNNGQTGYLGTQTLLPQVIAPSVELQFPVAQDVFNGIYTDFTVTKNGSPAPPSSYSVSSGKITFNTADIYAVTMTNQAIHYPAQVRFTVMVTTTPNVFHSDDKEGLRTFLRQPSVIAGKTNAEQLGLTISDTLSWQTDEAWVLKVADVWNDETPKRLLETYNSWAAGGDWNYKNLAGTLNANKWAKLEGLYCSGNQLISLDVSSNPQLTYLECADNQLSSLNLSNNPQLAGLICGYNQLSSLNLSSNPQLTILRCYGNPLSSLNLSSNPQLTELNCRNNQLSSLNVSSNPQLTELYCGNNQLSSLNVSSNPQLTYLDCSYNQLSSLNVSSNTNLTLLDCRYNQLSALNVNSNTQLTQLDCWHNQLSSLDLSANTLLTYLDCDQNQLSSLDVSANTLLKTLNCNENQLSTLDISANTQLTMFI